MPVFKIQNLSKSYQSHLVLNNVNLDVPTDQIISIMGPSGSGKTTLLLCILGFEFQNSGNIYLGDREISHLPIEDRQIAYLPQNYGLFPHLTVRDNIGFGMEVRHIEKRKKNQKVLELLDMVELPSMFADRNVNEISGGEQQRVALARALAIQPKLFLLDEPLSAIDSYTKNKVGQELRSLIKKQHLPALVVTHDLSEAQVIGDKIVILDNGKLIER